jgi:hypothetical protein
MKHSYTSEWRKRYRSQYRGITVDAFDNAKTLMHQHDDV